MKRAWLVLLVAALWVTACAPEQTSPPPASGGETWSTFNGDLMAQKYATDAQITPANVAELKKAWEVHTGDVSYPKSLERDLGESLGHAHRQSDIPPSDWSATPLFVNDTVYVATPFYRIFAVTPDSGKVKWTYDPHAVLRGLTQPEMKTRGLAYWQADNPQPGQACQKIVYVGTMEGKLHAVDADTGQRCVGFADHGVLNINRWNRVDAWWPLSILQPPTVYKDTLFIGWAGKDWAYKTDPPGTVFAVDARDGRLKWTFNALPPQAAGFTGTANIWASMSIDPKAGLLYLPVSSPSPNFYGGDRQQPLPLATSITALNVDTGQVVWSRQLVHHDLWDFDVNSAPVLVDLQRGGTTVPALVQSSKQGFLFVLNRLTGEPLFPITEHPVPASNVPGERAAPTQPFTGTPSPVLQAQWPGVYWLADLVSLGGCSRHARAMHYEGLFTPPSLGAGTLTYPGTVGGVEWGGGAVDPVSQTYVVNSSSVAMIYQLLTRKDYERVTGGREKPNYYDMAGTPYGVHIGTFLNWAGMPCWKPPYGTITAYDLKTGRTLWHEPFGAVRKWGIEMPSSWGSVTIGPPMITRTGLIFIGASMDAEVRALDLRTGKVLWSSRVAAPSVALPATYTYKGRQYVMFVAGGNSLLTPQLSDQLIAFALPAR
jgi:quinoprotein glucose dehydrogenase